MIVVTITVPQNANFTSRMNQDTELTDKYTAKVDKMLEKLYQAIGKNTPISFAIQEKNAEIQQETIHDINTDSCLMFTAALASVHVEVGVGSRLGLPAATEDQLQAVRNFIDNLRAEARKMMQKQEQEKAANDVQGAIADSDEDENGAPDASLLGPEHSQVLAVPTTWEKYKHLWITLIVAGFFLVAGIVAAILIVTVPPIGIAAAAFLANIATSVAPSLVGLAAAETIAAGVVFGLGAVTAAVVGVISGLVRLGQVLSESFSAWRRGYRLAKASAIDEPGTQLEMYPPSGNPTQQPGNPGYDTASSLANTFDPENALTSSYSGPTSASAHLLNGSNSSSSSSSSTDAARPAAVTAAARSSSTLQL